MTAQSSRLETVLPLVKANRTSLLAADEVKAELASVKARELETVLPSVEGDKTVLLAADEMRTE